MTENALPEILYHGTSTAYLDSKLRKGLLPSSSSCNGVCLTKDRDEAVYWASEMADWDSSYGHPCKPIVIAVPVSRLDPRNLKCDFNSVSFGKHDIASEHWSISYIPNGTLMYAAPIPISSEDIVEVTEKV